MSLWDEVKKNVVDLYTVTSDKTTEITKVSSRRWDKFGISRDIERQFGELGNLVYSGLKEGRDDILEDPGVGVLMSRIEALESELRLKEAEIEDIQKEHRQRRAAQRQAGDETGAGETEAGEGPAATSDDEAEVLITDPVLDEGREESAILVEPALQEEPEVQGEDVEVEVVADEAATPTDEDEELPAPDPETPEDEKERY
jgi:hypothetical protein